MKALPALLVGMMLTACGSVSGSGANAKAFTLGLTVSPFGAYEGTGPFRNLIYGSSWQIKNAGGGSEEVPASSLDSGGCVKSAPHDGRVVRALAVPSGTGQFICRYNGNG